MLDSLGVEPESIMYDNFGIIGQCLMPSILAIKPKEKYFNILFAALLRSVIEMSFRMKRTIIYLLQLVTVFRSMGFYDIKLYGDQSYLELKTSISAAFCSLSVFLI